MQSWIWKLLAASGIIGIGSFVVLEVQNRVSESRKLSGSAETATVGVETSVKPDAEAEFDRLLKTELTAAFPEESDQSDTVTPAPSVTDGKFVGVVDQKVNKEDLTDGNNPFAMDEPPVSEQPGSARNVSVAVPSGETLQPEPRSKAVTAFSTGDASIALATTPASVPSDVAGKSTEAAAATLIPAGSEKSLTTATSGKTRAAGSKYTFFGSDEAASTRGTATPAEKVASESRTASASALGSQASTIPVREAASSTPAVILASGTQDEPLLTVPSPVPDVSQPSAEDERPFERAPFDPDTPSPIERNDTGSSTIPARSDDTMPEFPPFDAAPEPASGAPALPVPRPSSTVPRGTETPLSEEPFSPDETTTRDRQRDNVRPESDGSRDRVDDAGDASFPAESSRSPFDSDRESAGETPLLPAPRPSPTVPSGAETPLRDDPFSPDETISRDLPRDSTRPEPDGLRDRVDDSREPSFPSRSSGSAFDDIGERGAPSRQPTDNNRSSSDEPFEMDNAGRGSDLPLEGSDVRPLPSADDIPLPDDRPEMRRRDDRTLPAQTEVLRPQLTIQKIAPGTASVGVSHKYTIVVANEGQAPAYDVIVEDALGSAATLVDSRPVAEYDRQTEKLSWRIAELAPNQKREIVVTITPTGEGTLDGVATVGFKAQVKSATVITAPKIELEVSGPQDAKVGGEVPLQFTIRNRGTSDAANVVLRSVLPPALQHSEGADLEYEVQVLRAGDQEVVDLIVIAAEPGERVLVSAEVTSNGVSLSKGRTEIEVVGAQLTLERRGPERRFVGRPALYQNVVSNESRFEAVNATVVEEIPEGTRFVSASNGGNYNAQNRRVTWTIPRLQAGKQIALEIELVTEQAGDVEAMVEVMEDAGFRTPLTQNTSVTVEDLHNVTADISRLDEPVAVGEQFGFTVTIENRGTAVARNVMMSVQVPLEIKVLAAGTRTIKGNLFAGNLVKYDTVPEIQPNAKVTFQIKLQGQNPSRNAPVKASLTYDEMPEPLVVSESVTIFDDRP